VHELGLCQAVVEAVERRAAGRQVARVRVLVGRLHHVHPDAFAQSFEVAAAGGVAAGATAELVLVPVRWRCDRCGAEGEAEEQPPSCLACGGMSLALTGGDELVLERIEYAAEEGSGVPRDPR
jgi:hydrogenase nickel incorporation protein HypA/HybF